MNTKPTSGSQNVRFTGQIGERTMTEVIGDTTERRADADGVSKSAFARAMSKLLKADRIHIEIFGPPSRLRRKLTPGPAPAKPNEAEDKDDL